jgi:hypothetical protein
MLRQQPTLVIILSRVKVHLQHARQTTGFKRLQALYSHSILETVCYVDLSHSCLHSQCN